MLITALQLTEHEARLLDDSSAFFSPSSHILDANTQICGKLWLDITAPTPEEWENLLRLLALPESDLEICCEALPFPQAEALNNGGLLVRLPTRNLWTDDHGVYLSLVLSQGVLLTAHQEALSPLEKTRRHLLEGDRPDADDMPGLLVYLLQGLMEADVSCLLKARSEVEQMGDKLEGNADSVSGDTIRHLKHMVGHMTGQCEEQLFCLTLLRSQLPHLPALTQIHNDTGELMEALAHIQRSLQRLENRLGDQLQQIDARLRNKTEQRIRLLTFVSAIFMPLTFITGFYGMNFAHMSILESPWGFTLVSGIMGSLSISMLVFFYWRGWFR